MATVDIVCIVAVVFFAVLGAWRGLISQIFSLAAFVLIAVGATPLGVMATNALAAGKDWQADSIKHLKIGMCFAAAVAIYILVKLVGALLNRSIGRTDVGEDGGKRRMAAWNRWWGAAFAVLKAGVLCWLVMCFFVAFPKTSPRVAEAIEQAWAGRTVALLNPVDYWIAKDERANMESALVALWTLKKHPGAYAEIGEEPSLQEVFNHPSVRHLLDEGKGDLVAALSDEGFRQALKDINWARIARIAEQALAEAEREAGTDK